MTVFSRMKQNRTASLCLVALAYLAAIAMGLFVYISLPLPWFLRLLFADIAATATVFVFSLIYGNASTYDAYWSVQPIVILVGYAVTTELTVARLLILIAVLFWGTRLTVNWGYTFQNLYWQDWRYTMLREKSGAFYPVVSFLGIHLFPTLVVYLCVLPAAYIFLNDGTWNLGSIVFFVFSLLATLLQGIADIEMHSYRRHKTEPFIRNGLWKYSRHPNYLGEILMWWAIGLFAISIFPAALYLMTGAFVNTLMFLFVSIPMAERRQSRKDGFDAYKNATRMLLPIKK